MWKGTLKSLFNIVNAHFHINFYHDTVTDNEQQFIV